MGHAGHACSLRTLTCANAQVAFGGGTSRMSAGSRYFGVGWGGGGGCRAGGRGGGGGTEELIGLQPSHMCTRPL
jgi:hypothetical protein